MEMREKTLLQEINDQEDKIVYIIKQYKQI